MTDWGHNSAFNAIWPGIGLTAPSILLNGLGNVTRYNNSVKATAPIPAPYTITFDPPVLGRAKRYLLRLINTSFESTFVFSIDNHTLEIVSSDFVPIHPYKNTSVLVGIGQRYHVIVEATNPIPNPGNYWIRTYRAPCFRFPNASPGYEKSGIVRYGNSQLLPNTTAWNFSLACSDETYTSLKPIVPWTVGRSSNDPLGQVGENLTVQLGPATASDFFYPLAVFSIGGDDFNPLQIDYGNPTFLNLNYTGKWNPLWVVYPENYTATDWVYLLIKGKGPTGNSVGAHPIHLRSCPLFLVRVDTFLELTVGNRRSRLCYPPADRKSHIP